MWINIVFFSLISFFRISYKTIWLKTWSWYKNQLKMKAGRAQIDIFQKIRIKNLKGVSEVRFKKLDSFTLETLKNHLIRNFCATGAWELSSKLLITMWYNCMKYIIYKWRINKVSLFKILNVNLLEGWKWAVKLCGFHRFCWFFHIAVYPRIASSGQLASS